MIDRYLLRIVVVLLLAVLPLAVFAQVDYPLDLPESEYVEMTERIKMANGFFLKGGSGDLSSVPVTYCSEGGYFDVVPSAWLPEADGLAVEAYSTLGGEQVLQTGWGEIIGSGQASVYRFYPDLVEEEFYGSRIYFYVFQTEFDGEIDVRITIESDYTRIFESPTEFELTRLDPDQCAGNTVTLQLSGSEPFVEYQLERGGTAVGLPLSGNGSPLTFTADQTGTYTVTAISQIQTICETPMDGAIAVEIFTFPEPSASSDASAYCEGEPIQLSGGPDGMASYSWTYPDGAIVEERNPLIASADYGSHNGTYTLTVESANGCSNTTTLNVEVNENPTATLPANFDVCEDAPLNFTTTVTGGAGPYSYAWTKDGNPIGTTTASISVPSASLGDAGVYEVTVTGANGCGAATASISIGVNERPVIGAVSNDGPACEGESITVTAVSGYSTYIFYVNGDEVQNGTDHEYTSNTFVDGDVVKAVIILGACSTESAEQTISVRPLPPVELVSDQPDNVACPGETVLLTASGADQYAFEVNGVQVQAPGATATYSAVFADGDQIIVYGAAANACVASDTLIISVNTPVATLALSSSELCVNEALTLTAGGGVQYEFFRNDVPLDVAGSASTFEVSDPADGDEFSVTVINQYGCEASASAPAIVVHDLPTATLNSDQTEFCYGTIVTFTAGGGDAYAFYRIRGG